MKEEEIKKVVRKGYAKIAKQDDYCCESVSTCCSNSQETISKRIGYTDDELRVVPEGANLGLGCGNPVALASLKEGETVLDLGSGAGFDCFLAAQKVGRNGKVIGVDMTPEMIYKARENAKKGNYGNVEFRLGEIENLPLSDDSVDVVISNCVINLSPNKKRVFQEAYRVLKPSGRLMISDLVLSKELPDSIRTSVQAYVGCISGAILRDEYVEAIREAGFQDIAIVGETPFLIKDMIYDPTAKAIIDNLGIPYDEVRRVINSINSVKIQGHKPERRH